MISRFFLTLILVSFGFNSFAARFQLTLTPEQQDHIVGQLNDFCGDAWCEGEYDLTFTSVQYQQIGKVGFYAINLIAKDGFQELNAKKINVICEIHDVALIQRIVYNHAHGISDDSESDLFSHVDHCLGEKLYK